MDRARSGRLLAVSTVTLLVVLWGVPAQASHPPTPTHRVCIAHAFRDVPEPNDIYYAPGCTGHDEPELDPLSNAPGSAKDLTWNVVLPTDGTRPVSGTGIFWFGGVVSDPQSLFNQAFVELQFYPDTVVSSCTPYGGYHPVFERDAYTACSPVWQINSKNIENAAFNAMLLREGTSDPLVMHAGDTVSVHFYTTAAADGFHETVQDLTTGQQGTIILDSPKHGPRCPCTTGRCPASR